MEKVSPPVLFRNLQMGKEMDVVWKHYGLQMVQNRRKDEPK